MKKQWGFSFFFILIIMVSLSIWNYKNRVYDWDMPGYIGSLYVMKFPDSADKIHAVTYKDIRKEAPDLGYNDIIGTLKPPDKARQAFANNTRAFMEQLPYYQIKVGYNLAVLFLYELGFSSPDSVLLLSIIAYFFSGMLLFYILKIIFPENYLLACSLSLAIMLLPPIIFMSRTSTPDMFVLQFLMLFILGFIQKWSKVIMFLILFAITFVRPDYIPLTLSYLASVGIYEYWKYKKIDFTLALQGIALLVFYFTVIKFYHYPGWTHLFYDTFINRRPYIYGPPPYFTFSDYLSIIFSKLIYFKKVTLTAVALLALVFYLSKNLRLRIFSVLIFINIYIKFLFFPHSSVVRFFMGFIVLLIIAFLYALSKKYNGFQIQKNA